MMMLTGVKQKRGYARVPHYATLALNCMLKNSKGTISASVIDIRYRNNNIE